MSEEAAPQAPGSRPGAPVAPVAIIAVGMLITGFMIGSACPIRDARVYSPQWRECAIACSANDGALFVERDGACKCLNGAAFTKEEAEDVAK